MAQADGHIYIDTQLRTSKLKAQLKSLETTLGQQESKLAGYEAKLQKLYATAKSDREAYGAPNEKTEAEIEKISDAWANTRDKIDVTKASIAMLTDKIAQYEAQAAKANETAAENPPDEQQVSAEEDKTSAIHQRVVELEEEKKRAEESYYAMFRQEEQTKEIQENTEKAQKSFGKFFKRVKALAVSALIFNTMQRGLNAITQRMGAALKQHDEYRQSLANLKGAFLTAFQPVYEFLAPLLAKLMNMLAAMATLAADAISSVFGKTLSEEQKAAQALDKRIKNSQKQMLSFDEINKLGDSKDEVKPSFSMDVDEAQKVLADGISGALEKAKGLLADLKDHLPEVLTLVGLIGAGFLLWSIAPGLLTALTPILGILLTIGGAIVFVTSLLDAWQNGIDLENTIGMFVGLAAVVGGLAVLFGSTAAGIALVIGGLAMLVVGVKDMIDNGMNLQNTLVVIGGLFAAGLGISVLAGSIIPALLGALAGLVVYLTYATGHGEELIAGIRTAVEGFKTFFEGVFSGDMEKAAEGLNMIWDGIKQAATACWEGIKAGFSMLVNWLDEKTGGKFSKIANKIIGIIESVVNFCIRGLNWLIEKLNKISFTVPDWVPEIGGSTVGISLPLLSELSLPRLAQGAVIPANHEFLSILGDQKAGTNIEAPLDTMVQAFRMALAEGGGQKRTVVFEVDKRQFAKVVFDLYGIEDRRIGVEV